MNANISESQKVKPEPNTPGDIFDDEQAARYVGGITARTVRSWRNGRGLPFLRITTKVARIRRSDLDKWLAQQRVAITVGGSR